MDKIDKCLIRKEDLDINNWEYVGEGNQHLLIRFTDEKAPLFGFLIRFNKELQNHSQKEEKVNQEENEHHNPQNTQKKAQQHMIKELQSNIQNYVFKYLFKHVKNLNSFLQEAVPIQYNEFTKEQFQDFVSKIEVKIYPQRSESKRDKKIDINQAVEIIENFQQNYGFSNSRYSAMVEIKPKSPLEEIYTDKQIKEELEKYTPDQQNLIMKRFKSADEFERCRFFKMQLNKLQNDPECKDLSKYRPINLYKGRVEEEMNNLLLTPLNNLNVTLYSGQLNESSQILEQVDELKLALHSVLRMIHLYVDYNAKLQDIFHSFESKISFYLQQPETFYSQVLNEILNEINSDCDLYQALQKDFSDINNRKDFIECKIVIKFLLSVAFRDLSLLINLYTTFDNVEQLNHQNEHQKKFKTYKNTHVQNELIHSRIAIIDNDLKPFSTFEKYMKIEKTNLQLYFQYLLNLQN